MMLYRGIEVTYETIREWCQKFGQQYANQLRRQPPYLTDKWHHGLSGRDNEEAAILFVAGSRFRGERARSLATTASGYEGG